MLIQFRIDSVLRRGFSIWLGNIASFTVLVAIVYAPLIVYTGVVVADEPTGARLTAWVYSVAAGGFVLNLVASAVVIFGVIQKLRGKPVSIAACMRVGVQRLASVVGVGIVSGGLLALSSYLVASHGHEGVGVIIFLPGILAYLMFFVAVSVAVVERSDIVASLRRSALLTRGYRALLFAILVVLIILEEAAQLASYKLIIGADLTVTAAKIYMAVVIGLDIVFGAITAVITAVAYVDLSALKGGQDIEALARVFE